MRSPRPRIITAPPASIAGTSDPMRSAIDTNVSRSRPHAHRSFNASSVAAASALPPPSPAATGMRFAIRISAPRIGPSHASAIASAATSDRFMPPASRPSDSSISASTITSSVCASVTVTSSASDSGSTRLSRSW